MTPLEYLYGRPERAVPALCLFFSVLLGLIFKSFAVFLGLALFLAGAWYHWSARLVIGDQRLGPVRVNCPDRGPWLTFDDGPGPDTLPIVRTLNRFGYRATFFFIGEQVERYPCLPELREALLEGGHEVGNHSYSHPSFLSLSREDALQELQRTQLLLTETFPESVSLLFRPPFGYRKPETFEVAGELELEVIGWSVNSLDFMMKCPRRMLGRLQAEVAMHEIVLFHDGPRDRGLTAQTLPEFLEWLKARQR